VGKLANKFTVTVKAQPYVKNNIANSNLAKILPV